jgi:5'-methylthioadenosine phosphorylase
MMKIGLIGGSGLAAAFAQQTEGQRHEVDTPFGRPSDAVIETSLAGLPVLFLSRHGPGHTLNPSQVPYRANIFALKQLGCTHIVASGAVGSLREELKPQQLVIPDQVIDKTTKRAGTFYERAAVHVEFAEPFCPVLRQILKEAGEELHNDTLQIHHGGAYVCMEGPAFSSRAESLMHRLWGGDLIGMTAMPEAKLAKEAEIPYALVALVTDYDSWKSKSAPKAGELAAEATDPAVLLKEIIGNLEIASNNAIRLIGRGLELIAQNPDRLANCPATSALKLAIWSDKSRIDPPEVEKLRPLWGRYFEAQP